MAIPRLEPLRINRIDISQGNNSPVAINLNFKDLDLGGLSKAVVTRVVWVILTESNICCEIVLRISTCHTYLFVCCVKYSLFELVIDDLSKLFCTFGDKSLNMRMQTCSRFIFLKALVTCNVWIFSKLLLKREEWTWTWDFANNNSKYFSWNHLKHHLNHANVFAWSLSLKQFPGNSNENSKQQISNWNIIIMNSHLRIARKRLQGYYI